MDPESRFIKLLTSEQTNRNSTTMSNEFPSFTIEENKTIIWKGTPLKGGDLNEVIYAARKARYFQQDDIYDSANSRLKKVSELLSAVLQKLPSVSELDSATPAIPPPPVLIKKTKPLPEWYDDKETYLELFAVWKKWRKNYQDTLGEYQKQIPEFKKNVETWEKYKGLSGINKMLLIRKNIEEILGDLIRCIDNPYGAILELSFEILPPGLWNSGSLIPHLGGNGWNEKIIVPERIDHLTSLNPQMVFRGNVYHGYNLYLLFLFGKGGPAVLETPIHGNATYVLHRDWLVLCKKSKSELMNHRDVTRIIHNDMAGWRGDVCQALKVKPPSHSNEY